MRIAITIIIALTLLISIPAHAEMDTSRCGGKDLLSIMQSNEPARYAGVLARAAEIPNGKALLWRVEKGGEAPSYLFGTIHISDARALEFPDVVRAAFAESRTALFELKMPEDDMERVRWAAKMMRHAALDGPKTLKDYLNDDEQQALAEAAKELGLYGIVPFLMKPELLAMQLSMSKCYLRQMKKGAKGVDFTLTEEAYAVGKNVIGLETVEEQLAAIGSISLEDGLEYLRYALSGLNEGEDNTETMIRRYLERRIDVLWAWSEVEAEKIGMADGAYDAVMEDLLDKRNVRMAERAAPLIDEGGAFIAVGALHLPGENGLVSLFRQRGYTVTAVY